MKCLYALARGPEYGIPFVARFLMDVLGMDREDIGRLFCCEVRQWVQ